MSIVIATKIYASGIYVYVYVVFFDRCFKAYGRRCDHFLKKELPVNPICVFTYGEQL